MSTSANRGLSQPGDKIAKGELKASADELIAMAKLLEPDIEKASSAQQLAKLMKANGDLLAQARSLIESDIVLVVGEAKIFADEVRAAVEESTRVIAKVADAKSKLAKVGAVLDFVAAVLTGSGGAIFDEAFKLKDALTIDAG
jgi:hypothetical protein